MFLPALLAVMMNWDYGCFTDDDDWILPDGGALYLGEFLMVSVPVRPDAPSAAAAVGQSSSEGSGDAESACVTAAGAWRLGKVSFLGDCLMLTFRDGGFVQLTRADYAARLREPNFIELFSARSRLQRLVSGEWVDVEPAWGPSPAAPAAPVVASAAGGAAPGKRSASPLEPGLGRPSQR